MESNKPELPVIADIETIKADAEKRQEIFNRWFYHTPLISAPEAVNSAMQEYAEYVLQGRLEAQKPDLSKLYNELRNDISDTLTIKMNLKKNSLVEGT